jgi:hypothetical protein
LPALRRVFGDAFSFSECAMTKPKLRGVTATETNADLGERFSA